MDLLQSQLGDDTMDLISRQIGADREQTSTAVVSALPMIIQAINRNAGSPQGAESLFNALSRDHDGSLLDDLAGFVGNAPQGPGAGIIRHVFGRKQSGIEEVISNVSGLDKQTSARLMEILAPIVMAQLGRQKRQAGLDIGTLAQLLNATSRRQERAHPKSTSLVNQLLDKDGDGSIQDDLTGMGLNALIGGFFRKRK